MVATRRTLRHMRRAMVAGLLIGAVACQASQSSPPGPSASTQPTQPSSVPTPSAPSSAGPIDIDWTEMPFSGTVTAVTADRGQFVAVGGVEAGLASWTSTDGTSWEMHAVMPPTAAMLGLDPEISTWYSMSPQLLPALMGRLARLDYTLYSFGTLFGPLDYLRPVGWRAPDPTTWEYIQSTNPFFGVEGYGLMDLVSSDQALLALNHYFGIPSGSIWRWTLDTSWVQTTPADGGVMYFDGVWTGDQFVVVGDRGPHSEAVSWVSSDGQTWQESAAAPALVGGSMRSVAVAPNGALAAVGSSGDVPAAWISTDGLVWTTVTLPGAGGVAHGLIPLDRGLVAVGEDGANVLTWTSPDGITWTTGTTLAGSVTRWEVQQSGGETGAAIGDTVVLFTDQSGTDLATVDTILWLGQIQP